MSDFVTVPELRFTEFENEWKQVSIEQISKFVTSGSRDWAQYYSSSGAKFIRMTNLDREGINLLLDELKYVSLPSHGSEGERTSLQPKDILISITAELGKIGLVPDDIGEAYINQHTAVVRTKSDLVNALFLAFKLSSRDSNKRLNRLNDAGAKAGLNLGTIRNFLLNLPDTLEQQKIATFLGSVDDKLNKLHRKRELLETWKRGLMQKIFSQQLRFTQDDGTDFPDWEEMRLSEIATFTKGKGISKSDIETNGEVECIRYGELYTYYRETISEVKSKTNVKLNDLVLSEANDVIIPASGETRLDIATASCVVNSGIALSGDLNIIRSDMNGVYLSYYFNSHKKNEIARLAQGISVMHLYSSQLKSLVIDVPCRAEQQKIANFLSSVDKKIEAVTNKITQTETFKKGLLQKMFV